MASEGILIELGFELFKLDGKRVSPQMIVPSFLLA